MCLQQSIIGQLQSGDRRVTLRKATHTQKCLSVNLSYQPQKPDKELKNAQLSPDDENQIIC